MGWSCRHEVFKHPVPAFLGSFPCHPVTRCTQHRGQGPTEQSCRGSAVSQQFLRRPPVCPPQSCSTGAGPEVAPAFPWLQTHTCRHDAKNTGFATKDRRQSAPPGVVCRSCSDQGPGPDSGDATGPRMSCLVRHMWDRGVGPQGSQPWLWREGGCAAGRGHCVGRQVPVATGCPDSRGTKHSSSTSAPSSGSIPCRWGGPVTARLHQFRGRD